MDAATKIDAVQTAAIIFSSFVLAYIAVRMERAFRLAADSLGAVLCTHADLKTAISQVSSQIEQIEAIGSKGARQQSNELLAAVKDMAQRLDRLEQRA